MSGIVLQKKCSSLHHGLLFFNHSSSWFDISSSFERCESGDGMEEE